MLNLPNEERLIGYGVSTCATCDGFFFREQDIAVVGGGDSAIEEAIFLTRFARTVTLIHRRKELRASKIMQDRAFANEKIVFRWDTVVNEVVGDTKVSGLSVTNTITGEEDELAFSGVFVAIGHVPNSGVFDGQLDVDEAGYIRTTEGSRTNVEGVFVCGDVQDHIYRQAITAAGSGCMGALDAERYLAELEGVSDATIAA
jgi:thioredoxin reductase (NADPH)